MELSSLGWLEAGGGAKKDEGIEFGDGDGCDVEEDEEWLWGTWSLASARAFWIRLDCRVSDIYCCSSVDKWYLNRQIHMYMPTLCNTIVFLFLSLSAYHLGWFS